jgi:hypothetical protein
MSGIATAVVAGSVITGVMSSNAQESAAESAAGAQTAASQASIDEQRRQFDAVQKLLSPYSQAGEEALAGQQGLLGLSGTAAQQQAIKALEQSPQMQALVKQGETSILQNASATGGLRGGNVQGALAQFRPQLLSQLIESQFSKLGTISGLGQASAAGQAAAAQQTGANIGNALTQQGQAAAGAALASGQAQAQMWGNIGSSIGNVATLKALKVF